MKHWLTISDLTLAWRKAKADLFLSSHKPLKKMLRYEQDLETNLRQLQEWLADHSGTWAQEPEFLGSWFPAPTAMRKPDGADTDPIVFSSPQAKWKHSIANKDHREMPVAEFRLMADCSMHLHVLSSLWLMRVGHLFDEKLDTSSYGNRLRRDRHGAFNVYAHGSFRHYASHYRKWRDDGISAMRKALEAEKNVVALTADATSFYHLLDPGFMLDDDFQRNTAEVEIPQDDKLLHKIFIQALQAWAANTPYGSGLPVGLPASAVIANMALLGFDQFISREVKPLHYGRYVDDILLVLDNSSGNFISAASVWDWLRKRPKSNLHPDEHGSQAVCYEPEWLRKSDHPCQVRFENSKNKVFLLEGSSGSALLGSIAARIKQQSSNWHELPDLPAAPDNVGADILTAIQADGEPANNLRKADALVMRRFEFAIRIRDYEAHEKHLTPKAWKKHRKAFLTAFIEHVLVPENFFELERYLPRVVQLAVACEDFTELNKIISALESLIDSVTEHCELRFKPLRPSDPGNETPTVSKEEWIAYTERLLEENIAAAFSEDHSVTAWKTAFRQPVRNKDDSTRLFQNHSHVHLIRHSRHMFAHDLARRPFKSAWLPSELEGRHGPATRYRKLPTLPARLLTHEVSRGLEHVANRAHWKQGRNHLPPGLMFATRPFNLAEVVLLDRRLLNSKKRRILQSVLFALRGFRLDSETPVFCEDSRVLRLRHGYEDEKIRVAVASVETLLGSLEASLKKGADPDSGRYQRLTSMLNQVLKQYPLPHYLILPELAVPAAWFSHFAWKLHLKGISLIAGIEYIHGERDTVSNQVWAALHHRDFHCPSFFVWRQDKQRPAVHEEATLWDHAGLILRPSRNGTWVPQKDCESFGESPPTVHHGDLRFAMLICSEFTNINYRASLRGKIDALFIPEWNQDVTTFNALVESAALDIHAYIIQSNNRTYGDSRIRGPYKDSWKRDIIKLKGGINDHFVIGEIDVKALGAFQDNHRSPENPYKPVPDGFKTLKQEAI